MSLSKYYNCQSMRSILTVNAGTGADAHYKEALSLLLLVSCTALFRQMIVHHLHDARVIPLIIF